LTAAGDHPGRGHRGRLRDKFLEHGLDKFTDAEVLELLLTLATPRKDCKQQARGLLKGLGSLAAVLEADPETLAGYPGVGPRNILGLKLVPAAARRYLEQRLEHMGGFVDSSQMADYLRMTMRPLTREVFRVILLNDDYTTMEFVVSVIQDVFHQNASQAARIMMEVHTRGRGVAGTFTRDIARTKADTVMQMAFEENYPLKCILEKA
jgi:ATP-dependent Clp protease adapter protein ClpS